MCRGMKYGVSFLIAQLSWRTVERWVVPIVAVSPSTWMIRLSVWWKRGREWERICGSQSNVVCHTAGSDMIVWQLPPLHSFSLPLSRMICSSRYKQLVNKVVFQLWFYLFLHYVVILWGITFTFLVFNHDLFRMNPVHVFIYCFLHLQWVSFTVDLWLRQTRFLQWSVWVIEALTGIYCFIFVAVQRLWSSLLCRVIPTESLLAKRVYV